MRPRPILSALLLFLLTAAPRAATGQASWKELRSDDGRFVVLMPGTPKESRMSNAGISLTQYVLETELGYFMVSWNDMPPTATPGQVLDNMRDGVLRRSPGTRVLGEKQITIEGHPGREVQIGKDGMPGVMLVRLYVVEKRLYTMMTGSDDTPQGAVERDRFLGSFRLITLAKR
jgi:hypothetical protein